MLEAASLSLDDEDLPIPGILIDGTRPADIAETLRLELPALRWRIERMLGRLQAPVGRVRHPLDAGDDESRPVRVDSPTRPTRRP